MGHLPNGNPVQKHSAGDLYPYVIYRTDDNGSPRWGVIGPKLSGELACWISYANAASFALNLKAGLL